MHNFILPFWQAAVNSIKSIIDEGDFTSFINSPMVRQTMFSGNSGYVTDELNWLNTTETGKNYQHLFNQDEKVPLDTHYPGFSVCGNSIHHIFHLAYYDFIMSKGLDSASVMEFGGGYGNLCRLYKILNPTATYIIIDLPEITKMQKIYLEKMGLKVNTFSGKIIPGIINLVSILDMDSLNTKVDLFITTWALSEATKEAQDFMLLKKYYGAEKALMAFQKSSGLFPFAENIKENFSGGNLLDTPFIDDNYYYFL